MQTKRGLVFSQKPALLNKQMRLYWVLGWPGLGNPGNKCSGAQVRLRAKTCLTKLAPGRVRSSSVVGLDLLGP